VRAAGLAEVGRGALRWLGFRIDAASPWSRDGRFRGYEPGRPVALSLGYARSFTRAERVKITSREWARLALADAGIRARWATTRERVLQDVTAGDQLTAVVVPDRETCFYDANRLLGRIDDPAFGSVHLAIWLDPRSAVAGLRAELLGIRGR
jgi:hypothetical protein